ALREPRPVAYAHAHVPAEFCIRVACGRQDGLQGLHLGQAHVVHVREATKLRGQGEFDTEAGNPDAWVDEVCRTPGLGGSKVRHEAVALLELRTGTGQLEGLARIVAERPAEKEGIVEDRVEAGATAVLRVCIPGR